VVSAIIKINDALANIDLSQKLHIDLPPDVDWVSVRIDEALGTGLNNLDLVGQELRTSFSVGSMIVVETFLCKPDKSGRVVWDLTGSGNLEPISRNTIQEEQELVVKLWDKSCSTLMATGVVNLRRAMAALGQGTCIEAAMYDKKNRMTGLISLKLALVAADVPVLPPDFEVGSLQIVRINAFELRNTELVGHPDPYFVIKIGADTIKTFTQSNSGVDVLFDYLDIQFKLSKVVLEAEVLEISCWDENSARRDALIGTAKLPLRLVAANNGDVSKHTLYLSDTNGRPSGQVNLFMTLGAYVSPKDAVIALPKDFTLASALIHRAHLVGWTRSTLLHEIYLDLQVNSGGRHHTSCKRGDQCVWDPLDIREGGLTESALNDGEIVVSVKEKNILAHDMIAGVAKIKLKRAALAYGRKTELSANVVDASDPGKSLGRLMLNVEIVSQSELDASREAQPMKQGFKSGQLFISKICAYDMANTGNHVL